MVFLVTTNACVPKSQGLGKKTSKHTSQCKLGSSAVDAEFVVVMLVDNLLTTEQAVVNYSNASANKVW